ncbi:MAG: beta-galactosidase trimerization domain-containing protein, partial [Oscillospiraceae bacterium]|nr:beta-galactosidase trimerization domain-containing protein [Oscillospiraceae bacterium]
LPTVFNDITGSYAEEYCPIGRQTEHIEMDGEQYRISQWCDIMALNGGETLAVYSDSFYKGKAAVTRNRYGKGIVYYIGTVPERKFCKRLMGRIFTECGIKHEADLPYGIEVTERIKDEETFRFIFNNTNKKQSFTLYQKEYNLESFEMKIENI